MKRVMGLLTVATLQVLIGAGTALAQTASYPPPLKPPVVKGTEGGTAFTGGNVSFGAVATLSLLAVGLLALFVARRRAARLAG
jgi:hypothetical protein